MTYLLDSDTIIDWLSNLLPHSTIEHLLLGSICVSVVSWMEVFEGVREGDLEARGQVNEFVNSTTVLPVDFRTAFIAANVRRELRRRKALIASRALDILITATAIEHDLILVTRNTRHYEDIPGLKRWNQAEADR